MFQQGKQGITITRNTNFFARTQAVTQYYSEINGEENLTKEEEEHLFAIYYDPNSTEKEKKDARDKVIASQLKFVVSAARQYSTDENYLDIIQQGNLGVADAFDHFNPEEGNRFNTLASWYIRRSIVQYKRDVEPSIRQTNSSKTFHSLARLKNAFIQKEMREPTAQELMDMFNDDDATTKFEKEYGHTPTEEELEKYKASDKYSPLILNPYDVMELGVTSIDAPVSSDDDDASIGDLSEFNSGTSSTNEYVRKSDAEHYGTILKSLMSILTDREKTIIKLNFGIDIHNLDVKVKHEGTHTPDEIGEIIGLSAERVRQLIRGAMAKLQEEAAKRMDTLSKLL